MFRKLLILGAIAALFTIVTAVPASAIAVHKGNGETVTVLDNDTADGPHDAHGPVCGSIGGCANHLGSTAAAENTIDQPGLKENPMPFNNVGAWNSVFQNQSPDGKAICDVKATDPGCL
jgi:hypothetical protein